MFRNHLPPMATPRSVLDSGFALEFGEVREYAGGHHYWALARRPVAEGHR